MLTLSNKYLSTATRRHIFAYSSVIMEPHNSLITSKNLLDD